MFTGSFFKLITSFRNHDTTYRQFSTKLQCCCPPHDSQPTRQRRGADLGAAFIAAVGVFGGDVAMGSSTSCGLRGFFGGCQDEVKANDENIRRLSDFQDVLIQFVTEFSTNTDKKLFLFRNELAALNAIQAEIESTQNRNWAFIQKHFCSHIPK